jgi:hypothetical protein
MGWLATALDAAEPFGRVEMSRISSINQHYCCDSTNDVFFTGTTERIRGVLFSMEDDGKHSCHWKLAEP